LLQEVIAQFGGVKEFARQMHKDYEDAPAGSVARQRTSAAIISLIDRYNELKRRQQADLEGLSDEDLEREAVELFRRRLPPLTKCPDCGKEFVPQDVTGEEPCQPATDERPAI